MNKSMEPNEEAFAVALEDDIGVLISCRGPCSQAVWMAKAPIMGVRISQLGTRGELSELPIEQPTTFPGYQR